MVSDRRSAGDRKPKARGCHSATITRAGLTTLSPSRYPRWTTSSTEPGSAPSLRLRRAAPRGRAGRTARRSRSRRSPSFASALRSDCSTSFTPVDERSLLVPLGGLERPLEVVEDRQELADEPLVRVRDQPLLVARGALAVVLEVGLDALGEGEVLVPLGRGDAPASTRASEPRAVEPDSASASRLDDASCVRVTTSPLPLRRSPRSRRPRRPRRRTTPPPLPDGWRLRLRASRLRVDRVGERPRRLLERVGLRPDVGDVRALDRLAELHDPPLDRRRLGLRELVAVLRERALGLVRELLAGVPRVRELVQPSAPRSACDSASEIIRSTSSLELSPEPPSMRICCSLPVPRSLADTLMIPFASMSNETSTCGIPRVAGGIPTSWNFPSVLLNETISDSPCADVDLDRRLVVLGRRERLRLAGRDGRVALDELREDAALRLDPERERSHVEQQDVLDLALEHAGLDRGADGDDLVRVHALVRVLADQLLDLLLHRRHAGHAADEDDVLDVRRGRARRRRSPASSARRCARAERA